MGIHVDMPYAYKQAIDASQTLILFLCRVYIKLREISGLVVGHEIIPLSDDRLEL